MVLNLSSGQALAVYRPLAPAFCHSKANVAGGFKTKMKQQLAGRECAATGKYNTWHVRTRIEHRDHVAPEQSLVGLLNLSCISQ